MHTATVPIGPLARRLAFGAVDAVMYHGQYDARDFAKHLVYSVYLRDMSEIRVVGASPTAVDERARELRCRLDDSIEVGGDDTRARCGLEIARRDSALVRGGLIRSLRGLNPCL